MKVLVIGNGFDIAHNLQTRYMNFLYACSKTLNLDTTLNLDDCKIETDLLRTFANSFSKNEIEMYKKNSWINYFLKKARTNGEKWIDFEEEIKNVCNISESLASIKNSQKYVYYEKYYYFYVEPVMYDNFEFDLNKMKADLVGLKEMLKKYISVIDSNIIKYYSKDILDFWPDIVISFNYTNTFTKVYSEETTCIHLHGDFSNNIVLGIDNVNSKNHAYNDFTKAIQRIKNGLVVNFDKLFTNNNSFLFYGLSFGESDKSTIMQLIEKSKEVFITYCNEKDKSDKVDNLSVYYENNGLLKLMESKLSFIQQTDLMLLKDGEIEKRKQMHSLLGKDDISQEELEEISNSFPNYYYGPRLFEKQINRLSNLLRMNFTTKEVKLTLFIEKALNRYIDNDVLYATDYQDYFSLVKSLKYIYRDKFEKFESIK